MRVREESGDIVVVAASVQDRGESGPSRRAQSGPVRWRGRRAQSGPVRSQLVRVQESMCSSRLRGPAPVPASVLVHLACARARLWVRVSQCVSACAFSSPDSARAHARALRVSSRRV